MLETVVVCATDTTVDLLHNRNYALWEDLKYQNGYMFTQSGEWQFYAIDEAQNRHVPDWTAHPMEGIYGTETPVFILNNELNSRFFTKQSISIPYSICLEETKYRNGITSYDICDEYLYGLPIKSICIPLR